jgi:tetratricopeptide (TPR) repeat protein
MQRSFEDANFMEEIDDLTKKGQALKRNGKIVESIELLENGIKHYQNISGVPPEGIAALKKSVAKLYYLQKKIEQCAVSYIEAIDIYMNSGIEQQASACLFHLGCCSDVFRNSKLALVYDTALQSGKSLPPGHPDSPFSTEKVVELTNLGLDMYNKFRSSIKSSFSDPRICPICNQTDQAVNVFQLIKSQSTRLPNGLWSVTNLGMALLALDSRPEHNGDEIKNWDRAAKRRDQSFYCSRCNEVFFTENGIKHHETLSNFKQLLYHKQ